MVNPVVWATGVVPSAPRVTVQVVPDTLVTAMISVSAAMSETWNAVGGTAVEDAAGNEVEAATVQFSTVPAGGGGGAAGGDSGGPQVGEQFSGHSLTPLLMA